MIKDSYANEPQSIGEIRAHKEMRASGRRPRDALISVLRALDAGEIKPVRLMVIHDDDNSTNYESGGDIKHLDALGLLETVKNIIHHQ